MNKGWVTSQSMARSMVHLISTGKITRGFFKYIATCVTQCVCLGVFSLGAIAKIYRDNLLVLFHFLSC